jgi:hypothetical protein
MNQKTKIAPQNMKKSLFSAVLSMFALMAVSAIAGTVPFDATPVAINWTLFQTNPAVITYKTNYTTTGKGSEKKTIIASIVRTTKDSFTTIRNFGNADFIALLENSLNTKFPAGTKLESDGNTLYVVDDSGTNTIDISSVLTTSSAGAVRMASDIDTTTFSATSTNASGAGSGTGMTYITVKYNDSALVTADGTTTDFKYEGVSSYSESAAHTEKYKANQETITEVVAINFTLNGTGEGEFRGVDSIVTGSVAGKPAGTETIAFP